MFLFPLRKGTIMACSKRIHIALLFFYSTMLGALADYKTVYVEDICKSNETLRIFLEGSDANSAGILRASRNSTLLPDRNCTIFILPPLGFGAVLGVRYLNMNPYEEPLCENYVLITDAEDTVKDVQLCGHSDDPTEYKTYYNTGPLKLIFHTEKSTNARSDFTFIVTAFQKPLFHCPSRWFACENRRCIWEGLTCDGHNNCGDQSDEAPYAPSNCNGLEAGAIIGISVGSIFIFLLFVVLPIVYCCRQVRKRNFTNEERRRIVQDSSRNESETISRNVPNTNTQVVNNSFSPPQTYQDSPPVYKP